MLIPFHSATQGAHNETKSSTYKIYTDSAGITKTLDSFLQRHKL